MLDLRSTNLRFDFLEIGFRPDRVLTVLSPDDGIVYVISSEISSFSQKATI